MISVLRTPTTAISFCLVLGLACEGTDPSFDAGLGPRPDASVDTGDASAGPDAGPEDSGAILVCAPDLEASSCGGSLTGRWRVRDACASASQFEEALRRACSFVQVRSVEATGAGSVEFTSEGTYVRQLSWRRVADFSLADDCLALFGGCSEYRRLVVEGGGSGDCTLVQSRCDCQLTFPEVDESSSGQYFVQGNRVALSAENEDYWFCQSGDALLIQGAYTASVALTFDRLP